MMMWILWFFDSLNICLYLSKPEPSPASRALEGVVILAAPCPIYLRAVFWYMSAMNIFAIFLALAVLVAIVWFVLRWAITAVCFAVICAGIVWYVVRLRRKPAAQVFRGNFKTLAERSKHRD